MNAYGNSNIGKVRSTNQDCFGVIENNNNDLLCFVCDGIGGGKAGDVASALTKSIMIEAFDKAKEINSDIDANNFLKSTIAKINDEIFIKSSESIDFKGMGTTLVGVLITNNKCFSFNIGDSRLYGVYKNELVLLTEDHNVYSHLIKNEGMTQEEASKSKNAKLLTNALGVYDKVCIDIEVIKKDFKYLLLCSDGLYGFVSEEIICEVLYKNESIEKKVNELIEISNEMGGYDNVTVLILER